MDKLRNNRRLILIAVAVLAVVGAAIPALRGLQTGRSVGALVLKPKQVAAPLPMDPWASEWTRVSGITLPLSAISTPNAASAPSSVQVAAMTDGEAIAFRVEWADDSQETLTIRPEDFADAVAIQLAGEMFNVCMGQTDRYSHIWQWKADWQYGSRDLAQRFPYMHSDGFWYDEKPILTDVNWPAVAAGNPRAETEHASPIEHLIAGGFSTLTTHSAQNVGGNGVWKDGRWAVIFTRPLPTAEETDFSFAQAEGLQVSFAVWDGKLMQRDGMKSTTTWATLELPATAVAKAAEGS